MAQDIYIKFKGDTSHLLNSVRKATGALGKLEGTSRRASASIGRLERSSKSAGGSILNVRNALIALGSSAVVRGITNSYLQFEKFKTVLTTFLGSSQAAEKSLARLGDLADSLPQDLADLTQGFVIFTRNGLDTSSKALTAFSNVATANGKSITQLAEAVADGLTGEFERLKEFGIRVGKENDKFVITLADGSKQVVNSSQEVIEAVKAMGAEGGAFATAAENNANTLSQAFSNLEGKVFKANVAFMDALKPALIEVTKLITQLIVDNTELIASIGQGLGSAIMFVVDNVKLLSIAFGGLVAFKLAKTLGTVATVVGTMAARFGLAGTAVAGIGSRLLALAGPIGWVVSAGLVLYNGFQSIKDKVVQVNDTTSSYGEIAEATLSAVGNMAKKAGAYIRDRLVGAYDTAKGAVAGFFNKHSETLASIGNALKRYINVYIGTWVGLFTWLRQNVTKLPGLFIDAFVAIGKVIGDFTSRALKSLGQALNPKNWFDGKEGIAYFEGFGKDVAATMGNIGSDITPVDWDRVLNADYVAAGADLVADKMTTLYTSVSGVVEDLVLDYRKAGAAAGDAADDTGNYNAKLEDLPPAAKASSAAISEMAAEIEKLLAGFNAAPNALDIATAGIEAFNRLNPLKGLTKTYRSELKGLELLRNRDLINEEEYLKTKAQLHRDYSKEIGELQKNQMLEAMRTSGVSNSAVLDATATSMDNIAKIQQGGVAGAIGLADQLGNVFSSLGTQNRKAFEMAKKFNIASAIMNTAVGISKAFAMGGPLGFLTAAAVAAAGFAQVAAIRSQQYSGRALGGPVMGGTPYMVGENGPEMFMPAQSGSIVRNDQLGGGENVNVNFTINAVDARGIDQLLIERKSVITSIISDAMLERGTRSAF